MIWKEETKYHLTFSVNGVTLTYTATNVTEDGNFISFIDKFGESKIYNKMVLISVEEVEDE